MKLFRILAPANAPITLEDAKAHMRVDFTDEDALIAECVRAAAERLDGRDGALGVCLIMQVWKLTLGRFHREIAIPLPPCQSIDAIAYLDPAGEAKALNPSRYQVFGLGALDGAILRAHPDGGWPATLAAPEAVSITFTAGFGDSPADVPEPIRASIKMRAAHLYENRESVTSGSGFIAETPDGADDFARNYRQWSF